VTLTDAAALLGVSAATLRQQIANGRLKGRKVGRDWTVTRREVERYRAESRRPLKWAEGARPPYKCLVCGVSDRRHVSSTAGHIFTR
jgi:excisionase family DNA binding protein